MPDTGGRIFRTEVINLAKQKRYNYIRRKPAAGTWPAVLTAAAGFLILAACIVISVRQMGNGPLSLGALGITSIMLSGFSVYHMFCAGRDTGKNAVPAKAAGILSLIVLLIWIFVIFIGFRITV